MRVPGGGVLRLTSYLQRVVRKTLFPPKTRQNLGASRAACEAHTRHEHNLCEREGVARSKERALFVCSLNPFAFLFFRYLIIFLLIDSTKNSGRKVRNNLLLVCQSLLFIASLHSLKHAKLTPAHVLAAPLSPAAFHGGDDVLRASHRLVRGCVRSSLAKASLASQALRPRVVVASASKKVKNVSLSLQSGTKMPWRQSCLGVGRGTSTYLCPLLPSNHRPAQLVASFSSSPLSNF